MSTRMNMASPRPRKDGKTHWHSVGTAWIDDKGTTLEFDSLPLPDAEGRVRVRLFEPRDNSSQSYNGDPRTNSSVGTRQRASQFDDADESAPF